MPKAPLFLCLCLTVVSAFFTLPLQGRFFGQDSSENEVARQIMEQYWARMVRDYNSMQVHSLMADVTSWEEAPASLSDWLQTSGIRDDVDSAGVQAAMTQTLPKWLLDSLHTFYLDDCIASGHVNDYPALFAVVRDGFPRALALLNPEFTMSEFDTATDEAMIGHEDWIEPMWNEFYLPCAQGHQNFKLEL